jgi:hypothetical protein
MVDAPGTQGAELLQKVEENGFKVLEERGISTS